MKVIVYLEGKSDQLAMETLLSPLVEHKKNNGILIHFIGLKSEEYRIGNNKKYLITKIAKRAVNIIINDPHALVVVIPDLYPKDVGFPHKTPNELIKGVKENFVTALTAKKADYNSHIANRFRVFCFKHDLEVLLLAAENAMLDYLSPCKPASWCDWKEPENQNLNNPPKRIVERLFSDCKKKYRATRDAPLILRSVLYPTIVEKCSQCFKPFVDFLEGL